MASSSPVLTEARDLGKYSERYGDGHAKPNQNVNRREIEIPRECAQCSKHIKKGKILVVCPCKSFIYCNKECQNSSNHDCQKTEDRVFPLFLDKSAVESFFSCYARYEYNRKTGRGPSSDRIEKLVKRCQGDPEDMMVLAEAGDPIAAYIVGCAFAERKGQGEGFIMPRKYLEKSVVETTEVAMKWLTIAAEGGIPEAMYHLGTQILQTPALVDRRMGSDWLMKAHATGKMDYIKHLLEKGASRIAGEFEIFSEMAVGMENDNFLLSGPTLAHLLMATRWKEIREWGGKTCVGDPFYGWAYFNEFMETVGELKKVDEQELWAEKKSLTISFIAGRPGSTDISRKVVYKERDENNTKFVQGVKTEFNPDYQLLIQTLDKNGHASRIDGGTVYMVSCKHYNNEKITMDGAEEIKATPGGIAIDKSRRISSQHLKLAGECQSCTQDAVQRLDSVAKGLYSISCTEIIPNYAFGARYVNGDGFIVEDIFKAYSKSDISQVLQCLMANPRDLHPLAVAEDQNLYWPIIWVNVMRRCFTIKYYDMTFGTGDLYSQQCKTPAALVPLRQSTTSWATRSSSSSAHTRMLLHWQLFLNQQLESGELHAGVRNVLEWITRSSLTYARAAKSGATAMKPAKEKTGPNTKSSASSEKMVNT